MSTKKIVPPADTELEEKLLQFLEKAQSKKQNIQSFVDYIQDGLFSTPENVKRYKVVLENHSQQRPDKINAAQGYWLGDLANLQKKRELLAECQGTIADLVEDKLSFKIVKKRHITKVEAIA